MGLMTIDMETGSARELMIRPRLLVDAARIGARLAATKGRQGPAAAERARLAEAELAMEMQRRAKAPAYRPARHVETLARLFLEPGPAAPAAQPKASGSAALRVAT